MQLETAGKGSTENSPAPSWPAICMLLSLPLGDLIEKFPKSGVLFVQFLEGNDHSFYL